MAMEGDSFQDEFPYHDGQHRTPREPFDLDDENAENGAALKPNRGLWSMIWRLAGFSVGNLRSNIHAEEMNGLMDGTNEYNLRAHPSSKNRFSYRWCTNILESALGISLLLILLNLLFGFATVLQESGKPNPFANWGKQGTASEDLDWYPTDFLRDITPIPCHSHNDYWRDVPLFSALYTGCISIEADVWEVDNDLLIGHNRGSLTAGRTFQALYVNPLVRILERQNSGNYTSSGTILGVFDTNPEQTLTLVIDVKTNGAKTWPLVLQQLEPLRQHNWLTHFRDNQVHLRPITIIGTGNTPFDALTANTTYRDAFYDAPLEKLDTQDIPSREEANPLPRSLYSPFNSYLASTSFAESIGQFWWWSLSASQLEMIRTQVSAAHALGLQARYWELPVWPKRRRNYVWKVLVEEGVDLLNVDDLGDVKGLW